MGKSRRKKSWGNEDFIDIKPRDPFALSAKMMKNAGPHMPKRGKRQFFDYVDDEEQCLDIELTAKEDVPLEEVVKELERVGANWSMLKEDEKILASVGETAIPLLEQLAVVFVKK